MFYLYTIIETLSFNDTKKNQIKMTKELTTKFINLLKGTKQTTIILIEIKRLEETIRLSEKVK